MHTQPKHAGIGLMTPNQVRYGQVDAVHEARGKVSELTCAAKPERFVKKIPVPPSKLSAVWINPPVRKQGTNSSLNSNTRCLNIIDTFRILYLQFGRVL